MSFETIMQSLKTYVVPDEWPFPIFLLPEAAMADIYTCIVDNNLHSCIELGTGHGTTSCIMAAAVDELGDGRVVTVDKCWHQPVNVQVLKDYTGLGETLEIVVDKLGYNWYLADLITRQTQEGICQPLFDFCLLDGAHEWECDALAFSLVAQLLQPGAWVVLDDLNFTLRSVPNWEHMFGHLSDRELDTCQIGMVYDLVVRQHPDFQNFCITHGGRLGWAQKKVDGLEQQPSQDIIATMQHQLHQMRGELQHSQETIAAMQTSKFWKLRTAWFKLKKRMGVVTENT